MTGPGKAAAWAATLARLDARAAAATVCPSEVARALASGGADWRVAMPVVHAAVDGLAAAGLTRLSWKGAVLAARKGPYRIGRGEAQAGGGAGSIRSQRLP